MDGLSSKISSACVEPKLTFRSSGLAETQTSYKIYFPISSYAERELQWFDILKYSGASEIATVMAYG
jgi:hypothetical protein